MRAAAVPVADPQLEFHWLPDRGFLIQGFLIQCLHRSFLVVRRLRPLGAPLRGPRPSETDLDEKPAGLDPVRGPGTDSRRFAMITIRALQGGRED